MLASGVPSYRRTTNVATTHGPALQTLACASKCRAKLGDTLTQRRGEWTSSLSMLQRQPSLGLLQKKRRRVGDLLEQICPGRVGFSPAVGSLETDRPGSEHRLLYL